MNVTTTPSGRSTVTLEVELPAARVRQAIEQSVRHLGQRTRIPGFRPGKAPRAMLERALGGPARIEEDAREHLFEQTVVQAIEQQDLDAIQVSQPEWLRFDPSAGAAYRVTVPVRPDVTLGEYRDFPFRPEVEPVDDAKVDQVVDQLRDQHASLVPIEDRGAENGDYAVIAFRGTVDGEGFEGGEADRFPLVIGSDRLVPGFEVNMLGMREGEQRAFEVVFPDDYPDEKLASRPVRFEVTLRELRAKQLPDADDDFAQTIGDYADLQALREEIRRRLVANASDRARHEFADRIIEFATANASVEIPDLLVEREVEVMHDELRMRLAEQRIGYEEYLKVRWPQMVRTAADRGATRPSSLILPGQQQAPAVPVDADQPFDAREAERLLHEEYHEPAEHRVKVLLTLNTIAEQEGIDVPDAEVEAEVARARERYADNKRLLEYFESPRGRAYIRSTLRRSRTVETLIDRWLAAHPEAGTLQHLEDVPGRLIPDASSDVSPGTPDLSAAEAEASDTPSPAATEGAAAQEARA